MLRISVIYTGFSNPSREEKSKEQQGNTSRVGVITAN
jgi:hypothetical protein